VDRELNTGTLDEQIQEAVTLKTKAAHQAADIGVQDEEPIVLGSVDQETAEVRRLGSGPLRRSKRRLSSDP
jgi:hypothetical protein